MARLLTCLLCAWVAMTAQPVEAAKCKDRGGRRRVLVRPKTPLRRGPGLNYGVAEFLEKARCVPYSEVSLDEQWVLIEVGRRFGWVPVKRLSRRSRRRIARQGSTGPVGSGQQRGTARVFRQSVMLERPDPEAPVRRVLPENLKVLPLAVTREGGWTQIRDERGDIGWVASRDLVGDALADLPRTETSGRARSRARDDAGEPPAVAESPAVVEAPAPPVETGEGTQVRIAVFGAALNPVHSLDSNGVNRLRRYDLSAVSPGTGLELDVRNLGPLAVRVAYTVAFLSGVSSEDVPGTGEAGGLQHDALLRVGWPVQAGRFLLTPELGYHFGMFDFDTVLAGQRQVVFLSTQNHLGSAGLRAQAVLLDGLTFDADVSGLIGITQESPQTLGDPGLTFGFSAQAGARYRIGGSMSILARYAAIYRTTAYSGQAQLDATITEATLVDISHGLLAGVAFDL